MRWCYTTCKNLIQTRLRLWDIKIISCEQISFLVQTLLFLHLTNKIKFGRDFLHSCETSCPLHVLLFCLNLYSFFFIRIYTSFHLSSIPHISHMCMPNSWHDGDQMQFFFEKKEKENSKHTHTTTTKFSNHSLRS